MFDSVAFAATYFPANTTVLTFDQPHPSAKGDHVIVHRPSTAEWIKALGTDRIGRHIDYPLTHWEAGDFDLDWDRTVVAATPLSITIDAPITTAIDPDFGGGQVISYR